jgi:hypothetical protein
MARDEQWFRGLLDADGILELGAALELREDGCFRVFSQDAAPHVRSAKWAAFALRFCEARLGITADKRYGAREVQRDAARVVLSREGLRETLLVLARAATAEDVSDAETAESRAGTYGLAALARRCPTVFVVEPSDAGVHGALLLSAILAGTELGPIVYPEARDLVGFKSAWARFQEGVTAAPYR